MNPLAGMANWPVPAAAGALLSPAGVLATFGDLFHPYDLASVTKPLTALAVLVAVEEGALELTTPLTALAGLNLQSDGTEVRSAEPPGATVAHLLAHASGIAPDRRRRAALPGTRRIYSNAGFEVLGELVAQATEMPFERYLAEAVFTPLGMSDATLDGSPARDGRASVTDLIAVIADLLGASTLLHPSTVTALASVQFPGLPGVLPGYGPQADNVWGLGFEIRGEKSPHWTSARNSAATYGHFGQSGTMFWIDPVTQLALVALADQAFGPWSIQAWPALSDAALDAAV